MTKSVSFLVSSLANRPRRNLRGLASSSSSSSRPPPERVRPCWALNSTKRREFIGGNSTSSNIVLGTAAGHNHQRVFVSSLSTWSFPRPDPPPSEEEVASHGLPLLRRVVEHAEANRPFLSEWPSSAVVRTTSNNNDGDDVDESSNTIAMPDHRVLSYQEVIAKAIQVSTYIQQQKNHSSSSTTSFFVAHSTIPGSDYIACQWGAFAANKASVPLSITQKTPEIEHVLQDCNPVLILVSDKSPNHKQVLEAAHNVNMSDRIVWLQDDILRNMTSGELPDAVQLLENTGTTPHHSRASLDQPALLLYTSGTTGKPKGVLHTHRNLYHQITDLVAAWEWQPEDVALHVLPLHHVHGVINVLSCAAYAGAQLQFQPFDPYVLWNQWANQPLPHAPGIWRNHNSNNQYETMNSSSSSSSSSTLDHQHDPTLPQLPRPTVFMAVPTIYAKLLEAARHSPPNMIHQAVERTLYAMRLQVSGSAALPTTILQEWQQLAQHTLLERYGMTECAMALSNPYNEIVAPRQAGCVGIPLPSVQVRLVDETTGNVVWDSKHGGGAAVVGSDEEEEEMKGDEDNTPSTTAYVGNLQVKGPTVFREYWNRPDATQEAFTEDGFFDTGDVAEYDASLESYRILGRASVDILKVGGHKVSALEIERVILEHPAIEEVVIVGIPDDEMWGQRVGMIARSTKATPTLSSLGTDNDEKGAAPLSLEEFQEWCEPRMERHKIPTRIEWLDDDIPKNAMGKVNKKELVDLFV